MTAAPSLIAASATGDAYGAAQHAAAAVPDIVTAPTNAAGLFNTGLILVIGGLLVPFLPLALRRTALLALPVIGLWHLAGWSDGVLQVVDLYGLTLTPMRVDALSFIFGIIFLIAAFLNGLYGLHLRSRLEQTASLVYAGGGIGAVLAGDLVTLILFWEVMAVSSVFLILARGTDTAYRASVRYLVIQILSGVLLIAGTAGHYAETGSIAFDFMGGGAPGVGETVAWGWSTWLIFFAFGIKAAFPLLHNWVQDAYPEATVVGTVVLSAFTTKAAIYCFARAFPGTDVLIPIGVVMTVFPVFFALIENDLRRVLAFSLNNQLGFMLVGIGIGSAIGINGAVGHAFVHILYKGLLFMSMGAVLYRAGTVKASELGGLYKTMPWTCLFCIVGTLSIVGLPLTSGFVTKALTLGAVEELGLLVVWVVMIFASAGVLEHAGFKVPYFTFFSHESGKRPAEAPLNMLLAMGLAALACIAIGVFPSLVYDLVPYPVKKDPYTALNVITKTQLLTFSVLAFALLIRFGLYPMDVRSTNLNTDWLYRVAGPWFVRQIAGGVAALNRTKNELVDAGLSGLLIVMERNYGPHSALARTWPISQTVFWVAVMLAASLLLSLS